MSIYVVSDIHGYADRFFDLLSQIDFDPKADELYVLGDIVDRGPQVGKICEWAWQQKGKDNIHFLLGNHEDMMLYCMRQPRNYWDDSYYLETNISRNPDIWFWNGGENTYDDLMEWDETERHEFIKWIDEWPLFYDIDVDGRRFVLVHAGISIGKRRLGDDFLDGGKNVNVEIPSFGEQWSQTLLWIRNRWLFDTQDLSCDVVFGHTPTPLIYRDIMYIGDDSWLEIEGQANDILHIGGRKHAIDTGRSRMGILRLNDMKEWYSEK